MTFWIAIGILVVYLIIKRGDVLVMMGRQAYIKEDFETAEKRFKLAEKLGGCSFGSKLLKAFLMLKMGKTDEAAKLFALMSMHEQQPERKMRIKMSHALVYWKRGEIETAIEMLEEVVEKYPNTAVYGSLGFMYTANGDITKAIQFNTQAYIYNDDDATIVDNLAFSHYRAGNIAEAERYYEEALELNPNFPETHYYYGKLLVEQGDIQRGLELMEQSLEKRFSFTSTITTEMINQDIESARNKLSGTKM